MAQQKRLEEKRLRQRLSVDVDSSGASQVSSNDSASSTTSSSSSASSESDSSSECGDSTVSVVVDGHQFYLTVDRSITKWKSNRSLIRTRVRTVNMM